MRGVQPAEKLMSYMERFLRYLARKSLWRATTIVFAAVFTFLASSVLINSTFDHAIRGNLTFFIVMAALLPAALVALIYLLFGHRAAKRRF